MKDGDWLVRKWENKKALESTVVYIPNIHDILLRDFKDRPVAEGFELKESVMARYGFKEIRRN